MKFNKLNPQKVPSVNKVLWFRQLNPKDENEVMSFLDNNRKFFKNNFPVTIEMLNKKNGIHLWLNEKIEGQKLGKSITAGIFSANKELFALVSAFNADWRVPKCEIAWMLGENEQGKGLATNAVHLFVNYLFEICYMQKIICRVNPENKKSLALAERVGFVAEGLHKLDFREGSGKLVDVIYLAKWAAECA